MESLCNSNKILFELERANCIFKKKISIKFEKIIYIIYKKNMFFSFQNC